VSVECVWWFVKCVWWFVVACSSSSVASTSATTNGATLTTSLFSVLSLDDEAAPRQPVKMSEGASGAIELLHLSEHVSKDEETLLTLIDQAKQKRCVASTEMNDASSRSHGVAIFTIEHGKTEGNVPLPKAGKLYGKSSQCCFPLP
jgi:hypothetical protein